MRLEGPFQSWGEGPENENEKKTLTFPTRSGVSGIILAAMGLTGPQREFLERLSHGKMEVTSWSKGYEMSILTDQEEDVDDDGQVIGEYKVEYLQNAAFTVIFEVDSMIADKIGEALHESIVTLGREDCIPSEHVYEGVVSSWTEAHEKEEELMKGYTRTFIVSEVDHEIPGLTRRLFDVPVSFGKNDEREFGDRLVKIEEL